MRSPRKFRLLFVLEIAGMVCIPAIHGQTADVPPPTGAVLEKMPPADMQVLNEFQSRVVAYLDTVHQVENQAPKEKSKQPIENLDNRRKKLQASIRAARHGARQGDIFTAQAATVFRRLLAETMSGSNGTKIRASLLHAEPLKGLKLEVNGSYPNGDGIPLQSTPPSLLVNLPPLPLGVEYRIVDHMLLLRDTQANIIVDFLPDAFPKG